MQWRILFTFLVCDLGKSEEGGKIHIPILGVVRVKAVQKFNPFLRGPCSSWSSMRQFVSVGSKQRIHGQVPRFSSSSLVRGSDRVLIDVIVKASKTRILLNMLEKLVESRFVVDNLRCKLCMLIRCGNCDNFPFL